MWRSPVAQRSGGPEVASSNLVIPTKRESFRLSFLFPNIPLYLFLPRFVMWQVLFCKRNQLYVHFLEQLCQVGILSD